MEHRIQIAPSLLACDFSRLAEEISAVEKAGADLLHFDVMDGHFVPNITLGVPIIERLRPLTKLPFDAHLMIENCDRYLDDFARAGCNWISVHVEACPHINRTLNRIKDLGMRAGIALNPGTTLQSLDAILPIADYVLIMSVNPGFGGQAFIPTTLDRVRQVRSQAKDLDIEVDGGIKTSNIGSLAKAGANVFVVGTGLFEVKAKRYDSRMAELKKAAKA